MSFLRTPIISRLSHRAVLSRPLCTTPPRFAAGYGDGKGDPKGSNPQSQGAPSHATNKREHPGPDPPSEGAGTGGGPTKGGKNKTPEDASAQSGGARSMDAKESGSSPTGGEVGGGKDGAKAKPKIHDRSTPGADSGKEAEVEQHNRKFEKRYDRAATAADEPVDKKFWKGQGGAEGPT